MASILVSYGEKKGSKKDHHKFSTREKMNIWRKIDEKNMLWKIFLLKTLLFLFAVLSTSTIGHRFGRRDIHGIYLLLRFNQFCFRTHNLSLFLLRFFLYAFLTERRRARVSEGVMGTQKNINYHFWCNKKISRLTEASKHWEMSEYWLRRQDSKENEIDLFSWQYRNVP